MKISKKSDRILSVFAKLPLKRICVVGDLIIDHYRIVSARKISPEAPVLVTQQEKEEYLPGGASNVVANLSAFGVGSVHLITVVGRENQDVFSKLILPGAPIVAIEADRLNTVKERIITRRQQLLRIDRQSGKPIRKETAECLFKASMEQLEAADAIVFSDYNHGVCIPDLVSPILNLAEARGIPTIVDSKSPDTMLKYRGATIALPNLDEARIITGLVEFDDEDVVKFLFRNMKLKAAAVTLGSRGILFCDPNGTKHYPPLHPDTEHEVTDVSGAGDTVAATVAMGLASGMDYDEILKLSNITAGVKVGKRGVATVSEKEIIDVIERTDSII